MQFPASTSLLLILFALAPTVSLAQKSENAFEAGSSKPKFEIKATVASEYLRCKGKISWEEAESALNALLEHVNPAEVAAEVLKCPADKIQVVPHISWSEPKYLDWLAKAMQVGGAAPTTGPEGKFALEVGVAKSGRPDLGQFYVSLVLAPSPNAAGQEIANRIAVKMVREAPEFYREYIRQQRSVAIDRLHNRIRGLDDQADKLRRQMNENVDLSQVQLAERLADLEKQQLATRLSLEVLKAREDAIRNQLMAAKKSAESKAADNQTLATLSRIVEVRKERLQGIKGLFEKGAVSREDMLKAEEDMLTAMVEVDRAKASLQKSESRSQIDSLTADLSKIAIDHAEAEARLAFLERTRNETHRQLAQRMDTDAKTDALRAQLKALEHRRAQLQEQLGQAEDAAFAPIEPIQLSQAG